MEENGEFILWGIGKTDWEIPHFSPLVPPRPSARESKGILHTSILHTSILHTSHDTESMSANNKLRGVVS